MILGTRLLTCVLLLTVLACTEQTLPEFRNPVPMSVPGGQPAIGPRLIANADQSANLSWMERSDDATTLRFAPFGDDKWLPAVDVVADAKMFVNWADLPGVTTTADDALIAHWLSYTSDGTYSYQILTARSGDGGATWSAPTSPHTDGTPTEHGFVSTYPDPAGTGMIWLDGRNTPEGGMTLRGAVIAADGSLSAEVLLDELVCDCCQTDIAMSADGPVAVYRDRTTDEVRDIYWSRYLDGRWQTGQAISDDAWVIDGCPVNGPAIAANGKLVVVAWFTATADKPIVKTAFSRNSGKTFSKPLVVSSSAPLGRVGISTIGTDAYVVSWLEPDRDGTFKVNIRSLTTDGQVGPVQTVGRTAMARIFPQMVRVGDKLILAWTDAIDDLSKVVSVRVTIADYYDLFAL